MPGKHNKCCCPACPDGYCIPVGTAQNCEVESAVEYRAIRNGDYINGDVEDECATEIFDYVESFDEVPMVQPGDPPTGCCWLTEYDDPAIYTMELCIEDEDNATLTLTIVGPPEYTIVWLSVPGYDPLCTSRFVYSEADSNPPPDCSWPEAMCVEPLATCCPDVAADDWPLTLYVTLAMESTTGDAEGCECGDAEQANNTLTWDPATASWKGEVDFGDCGTVLDIEITCNELPPDGLTRRTWELFIQLFADPPTAGSPGCVSDNILAGDIEPTDSCVPFAFSGYAEFSGNCCEDGGFTPFTLYITE